MDGLFMSLLQPRPWHVTTSVFGASQKLFPNAGLWGDFEGGSLGLD